MKVYNWKDRPIKVYGIPFFDKTHKAERLPEDIRKQIPSLEFLGRRCSGARVAFKTNSEKFTVKIKLETFNVDIGMSIYACQSGVVMIGNRQNPFFAGLVNPKEYGQKEYEREFTKTNQLEDVTIYLPRNEVIEDVEILIEDDASILAPTPYTHGPVLFYGSSITEGGCCTKVTNSYVTLLSDRLDFDFYNFGFSGNAKGELEIADYINTIEKTIFVYDYDHNAPDLEHLRATHEPFFKRIRNKNPEMPIIIMSKPDFEYGEDNALRRDIIKQTYNAAVEIGDKNVYFIDGEKFFGENERHLCTVDTCHPNDLGFYRIAEKIEPIISKILKKQA